MSVRQCSGFACGCWSWGCISAMFRCRRSSGGGQWRSAKIGTEVCNITVQSRSVEMVALEPAPPRQTPRARVAHGDAGCTAAPVGRGRPRARFKRSTSKVAVPSSCARVSEVYWGSSAGPREWWAGVVVPSATLGASASRSITPNRARRPRQADPSGTGRGAPPEARQKRQRSTKRARRWGGEPLQIVAVCTLWRSQAPSLTCEFLAQIGAGGTECHACPSFCLPRASARLSPAPSL